MTAENIIRQLLAVRATHVAALAQIDATLGALEEALAVTAPVEDPPKPSPDPAKCAHPEKDRIDTTGGGGAARSWFCPHCRHASEELGAMAAAAAGSEDQARGG